MKKRHALTGLVLLAAIALLIWQNHQLALQRDALAGQLAEAQKRMRWLDSQIARLSNPTAAQLAGAATTAAGKPEKPPTPEEKEELEDENGEIPVKDDEEEGNPYSLPANSLYGPFKPVSLPVAEGRITMAELRQLGELPPVEAGDYILKARLLGGQGEELATAEVRGTDRGRIQHIKEFPFPTEFDPPQNSLAPKTFGSSDSLPDNSGSTGSFPVTPSTPGRFDFKDTGWTIDLSMSARGGLLVVNGRSEQVAFEGFTAQPGETAKPIYDDSGILLSDNKHLQPAFTTRESPFTFDMLPGKTYRLPLPAGDEGTVLELTPVPSE